MKKAKYRSDLPHLMYTYFIGFSDTGAPSFDKFARTRGLTMEDLIGFKKYREFDRAFRECSEIRRDYLIDGALAKRLDPSTVKYLLSAEFHMDEEKIEDEGIQVTLEVIG